MGAKHITELLIEANKKMTNIIDKAQNESSFEKNRQCLIDDVNNIIRELDHLVEHLERTN